MNSLLTHVIGIDISKDTISLRLLGLGDSPHPIGGIQTFSNCETGYRHLERWLCGLGVVANSTQVVMEATGVYWEGCAWYCHEHGFQVSVVNPAQIKYFARTTLMRGKTDPLDADLIARFGVTVKPLFWTPPDETLESLRIFVHQREAYGSYADRREKPSPCLSTSSPLPKKGYYHDQVPYLLLRKTYR